MSSIAWKYFIKNEEGTKAKCTFCNTNFKYCGSTTSLINHLTKKHTHSISIPDDSTSSIKKYAVTNRKR